MTLPAIRVHNLSKQYQIGLRENRATSFREAFSGALTSPIRRLKRLSGRLHAEETFWALKDVSFEVQPGEVIGIIGRNGAGKSTLLKILAQITEPTTGRVETNGRVASLLEVGTGFHPELTGRENVFLNGAILGMSREEIKRKFDEIVDFSGVEKFLDTPVKRYSSGMSVRLAFAVAAHLEPEILIVDEVLAVGDAAFQSKCLGKMNGVAQSGRTILFVSHNMSAVESLCPRAIMLKGGTIARDDQTSLVMLDYSKGTMAASRISAAQRQDRTGSGIGRLVSIRTLDDQGHDTATYQAGSNWNIELQFDCNSTIPNAQAIVAVSTLDGRRVTRTTSLGDSRVSFYAGINTVRCAMENVTLVPGIYELTCVLRGYQKETIDRIDQAAMIEVLPNSSDAHSHGATQQNSLCYFKSTWEMNGKSEG